MSADVCRACIECLNACEAECGKYPKMPIMKKCADACAKCAQACGDGLKAMGKAA
jgi:hypothetical protein